MTEGFGPPSPLRRETVNTNFGLHGRREYLKTAVNRCGLQTILDDLDVVVAELAREWKEDDAGAAMYLEAAHRLIRECANRVSEA